MGRSGPPGGRCIGWAWATEEVGVNYHKFQEGWFDHYLLEAEVNGTVRAAEVNGIRFSQTTNYNNSPEGVKEGEIVAKLAEEWAKGSWTTPEPNWEDLTERLECCCEKVYEKHGSNECRRGERRKGTMVTRVAVHMTRCAEEHGQPTIWERRLRKLTRRKWELEEQHRRVRMACSRMPSAGRSSSFRSGQGGGIKNGYDDYESPSPSDGGGCARTSTGSRRRCSRSRKG